MTIKIKTNKWFKVRKNVVRDGRCIVSPGQDGWAELSTHSGKPRYRFYFDKYQWTLFMDKKNVESYCKQHKIEKYFGPHGLIYASDAEAQIINVDRFNAVNH